MTTSTRILRSVMLGLISVAAFSVLFIFAVLLWPGEPPMTLTLLLLWVYSGALWFFSERKGEL